MTAQTKNSDTAKMSHTGKVANKPRSKGRKLLRLVLWGLPILAILAGIILAFIWYNRTSITESQIRKLMDEQGYDVELNITKLSKTRGVATDIVIGKDNKIFFKAERAVVDYDFGKRMAQRIELVRPYINVEFDIKGNITSSWMKPSPDGKTGSGQKLLLPPGGLVVNDAIVDWQMMLDADTLLGSGQANVIADIKTDTDWNANISGTQTRFSADILSGDIENDVFIETKDGKSFDVFGSVDVQNLSTDLLFLSGLQAKVLDSQFKLNFIRAAGNEPSSLSGWYSTKIETLSLQDYEIGSADIKISEMHKGADGQISANWQMDAKAVQISNKEMRRSLADKLSAHSAMANTPIAQYFTGTLFTKTERLLSGFDVEGRGLYTAAASGYKIDLDIPLRLSAAGQEVVFTKENDSFTQYDKADAKIRVQSGIDWSGVQALKLTNFNMTAQSTSGIRLDAVQSIKARISSKGEWRLHNAKDEERDDVRLAPFDIDFAYTDQGRNIRNVRIDGGIDYDGPVPGGSVIGLVADGAMDLRLRGDNFTLGYTPSGPLSIAAFANPSGWTTKALKFTMEPQTNLLSKTAQSGVMHTILKDVSTQIIGPEDKRHLDARFNLMDVTTDFAKSPQHWQIKVSGTDIKSDDFPAPGTHIVSKGSTLNVFQAKSGDMTFDLLSPHTQVATDNASIANLNIGLSGSPDDIALKYNAGSVTMVGGAIPVLPMHGTARLKSGELTGHAVTNLPRTTDTPIDIHYRSKDGQGSAKILIPKIIFDPRGLQPQHLIPVLRGKLADVSGEVSAEFDFVFGGGQPVRSSGSTELKNLNIGTLVGPVTGINSKLILSSIFPLKTAGIQTAMLAGFDPGFPLKDGTIKFEIVPDGITVYEAAWPIENIQGTNGKIFLTPTNWQFGDVENLVTVNVENVGLDTMMAGIGKDKFSATGQIYGTLPARIKGVDVLIDKGALFVKDGGIIRYKSAATDAAAARNTGAVHAFKALENFHYKQLEAHIDGPIDGAMALKIVFDGQNPDVLSGQTFQFNTQINGELANIARNMAGAFSNEENLARIMEIRNGEQAEQP